MSSLLCGGGTADHTGCGGQLLFALDGSAAAEGVIVSASPDVFLQHSRDSLLRPLLLNFACILEYSPKGGCTVLGVSYIGVTCRAAPRPLSRSRLNCCCSITRTGVYGSFVSCRSMACW